MSMSVPGNSCSPCKGVSTTSSGCMVRLSGECVYYSGTRLAGPGINTGDSFNTVVVKLNNYISNAPTFTFENGLTSSGSVVSWGQSLGESGDPGALTSDREIPLAGFNTYFTGSGSVGIGTSVIGTGNVLQVNGNAGFTNSAKIGSFSTFRDAPVCLGMVSGIPFVSISTLAAPPDSKVWTIQADNSSLSINAWNDSITASVSAINITRVGANITKIQIPNGNFGIGSLSPNVSLFVGTVDAIRIPTGAISDRPTPTVGYLRTNTDIGNSPEYYDGSSWEQIPGITSGVVAPSNTPKKVGDIYIDTSAKKLYFATGTTSSADWTIAN